MSTHDGVERRRRGRRAADGDAGEQRDANESLVLATFRAEDDAASARGGQGVAEASARLSEEEASELRTTQTALELALSEAARLNAELARAADGEQHARAEAEAANRAKDEFLAMLGHELRNPLAPIVTALQLMKLRGDPLSKEYEVIERQMQYVVRLVDDLLDASRITRGKVELVRAPVELSEIVAVAVEMASPLIARREHRLTLSVPAHGLSLDADPARLAQVISNLLTNAARYTPPSGDLAVVATRSGDSIELIVSDNGIGIEKDMLARVFDLFVQAKPSSGELKEGGLGLGLALVRNLVSLHGGTVEARSEGTGRGTSVVIRLPARRQQAAVPSAVVATPERRTRPRRILLVDDNVDAADMLADVLRSKGHEVVVAYDGPDALRRLDQIEIDTAILDIGLPVMDGYELASHLRARAGTKHARLIALTGYGQETDRERSRSAGFDEHLVKPVMVRELVRTLAEDEPREVSTT